MKTLDEHLDDLDRMVDTGAKPPETRNQIAFIHREVLELEEREASFKQAAAQLEQELATLESEYAKLKTENIQLRVENAQLRDSQPNAPLRPLIVCDDPPPGYQDMSAD
jgi:septal ring factor EnvC (AmiA/AmiB activator)